MDEWLERIFHERGRFEKFFITNGDSLKIVRQVDKINFPTAEMRQIERNF